MRKPNNKTEVQVWRLSPPLSINRWLLITLIYQSVKICFNFLFAPTNNPLQLSLYSATPPVYLLPRICPLETDRWFKYYRMCLPESRNNRQHYFNIMISKLNISTTLSRPLRQNKFRRHTPFNKPPVVL